MSTTQRKRRMMPQQSRRARRQRRSLEPAEPEAEIVETGAEVVDLTCESSEPVVVDLTNNDSVEIVDEDLSSSNSQPSSADDQPGRTQSDSCILCSDEEDTRADGSSSVSVTSAAAVPQGNRLHPALCNKDLRCVQNLAHRRAGSGTISCPICMDGYTEIVQSGRLIVSTKCGHVFCSQCIRDSLKNSHMCPTCRKKLNTRQYHPIYI
ncbi:RING finger protein 4 [Rhincodon typus]|uniref:RING finger protein 4 n=1 Tax=Rhincodon typus TaxID=259920 RepID=UPI00203049A3|nr:RING finger protein 4 [Rhincodon typus]XP_048450462.1 RING finger protein 4 [Rhincodon typus]XP_048450465.1 RING finger protein 4 [Rhincodon typus]XP_048450470.1 RING finger protein 4 [Rhincodon typus]